MDARHATHYFQSYVWVSKHALFGYPEDRFPDFEWIKSLETRFQWLRRNYKEERTAGIYLIKEMIQWGGSQNGRLQQFEDGIGEVNLFDLLDAVVGAVEKGEKRDAIEAALRIPGMGLTYGSKLLRFLDPSQFGALDSRLREALEDEGERLQVRKINDSSVKSRIEGYLQFLGVLERLSEELRELNCRRPGCGLGGELDSWRPADTEMVLFQWAAEKLNKKRAERRKQDRESRG